MAAKSFMREKGRASVDLAREKILEGNNNQEEDEE
jgi:hypothetical protein